MQANEILNQTELNNLIELRKKKAINYINSEAMSGKCAVPITSLARLKDDMSWQAREWNLVEPSLQVGNVAKRLVKRLIKKMTKWYLTPILEQQRRFNLRTVRILDDAVRVISYMQENQIYNIMDDVVSLNRVNIDEKKNDSQKKKTINFAIIEELSDVEVVIRGVLIYHYYNQVINPNSHLFLILKDVKSDMYLQCIMAQMSELKVRNMHVMVNPDPISYLDYCNMSTVLLSLSGNENINRDIVELARKNTNRIALLSKESGQMENLLVIDNEEEEIIAEKLNYILESGC